MKAKCTTCEKTFDTDAFGPQPCPHCGTQVHLVDPKASPAGADTARVALTEGGDAGGDAGSAPAEDTRSPWEAREEHGTFGGFVMTAKLALFHPADLFATMTAADTRGAFSFAWISTVIGGTFAFFWGFLQWKAQAAQMDSFAAGDPRIAEVIAKIMPLMDTLYGGLGFLILPVSAVIGIFLMAGILHLMVMMVGANNRGFHATFRAYCFAQAPQLFAALPGCGGIVSLVWSLVLTGFAIRHLQRCSGGKAAASVLLVLALGCLCCCLVYGIVIASVMASVGAG